MNWHSKIVSIRIDRGLIEFARREKLDLRQMIEEAIIKKQRESM